MILFVLLYAHLITMTQKYLNFYKDFNPKNNVTYWIANQPPDGTGKCELTTFIETDDRNMINFDGLTQINNIQDEPFQARLFHIECGGTATKRRKKSVTVDGRIAQLEFHMLTSQLGFGASNYGTIIIAVHNTLTATGRARVHLIALENIISTSMDVNIHMRHSRGYINKLPGKLIPNAWSRRLQLKKSMAWKPMLSHYFAARVQIADDIHMLLDMENLAKREGVLVVDAIRMTLQNIYKKSL